MPTPPGAARSHRTAAAYNVDVPMPSKHAPRRQFTESTSATSGRHVCRCGWTRKL